MIRNKFQFNTTLYREWDYFLYDDGTCTCRAAQCLYFAGGPCMYFAKFSHNGFHNFARGAIYQILI